MDKNRCFESKFNELLNLFPVVAILGPRQCGKSTFVKSIGSNWKYYDLESPENYKLITTNPLQFFALNPDKIIIDEAQQYPDLFKVLRGVIDSDRQKKGRFILTGSSSPEIVKGLTESLAGRISTLEIWPFKACEFYQKPLPKFYEIITRGPNEISALETLIPQLSLSQMMSIWYQGGFPEPLIEHEKNKHFYKQWMENYIANYISRDIRGLFPRLNIHSFKQFLTLLSQFSGHQLNMSEMSRSLEINMTTVKDYLEIIHQTFLWRNLGPFEKNNLKKIQKSKKGFFRDQGILHYYLKINSLEDLLLHPVAGFSFECFVIEELIRGLLSTMETQLDFSYYRTIDKSEVDFILDGPFGIIPFEIKLGQARTQRSQRGLINFVSDMKLPFGILINSGSKVEWLHEKVLQVPVNFI
jgi:uncharacterized protein